MRTSWVLLLFILNSALLFPSNKLAGIVTDKENGAALTGVNILVQKLNIGAVTNSDGAFIIDNLPDGVYNVRFSYLGYSTEVKSVIIPSDSAENIKVALKEASINLNEVVVTGNPFLAEPKDISQTTISLSKLDLIISSNQTIADALNFQPGVAMRSNGIATGRPVIRGFSNNKVLILEDGLRMGDLSNASDDHSMTDDGSEPEKIEVLEGPSSLLYGSNAIGGVVNIITDAIPPVVQQGINGEVLAQGSTVNNEYLGNVHLNYGIGQFSFHGKFFKRKGDDYKIAGGDKTFNSDLNTFGSQGGVSYLPEWGMVGFSFTDFNNKYGLPTMPGADEIVYIDMNKKQYRFATEVNNINSFITSMNLKAGYLEYEHKEISRLDGSVGTAFGLKTKSADLSLVHKPFSENSTGVIGFFGLIQNYNVVGDEALTPNADYGSFAAYFLEKFKYEKFSFSFGARYEFNKVKFPDAVLSDSVFTGGEDTFNSFSLSAGIVYNLSNIFSLYFNAANAYRAPTIEELSSYAIHEAVASFDIGNRELDKENTTGFDLGIRAQSEKYYFEIAGYYNKINNLIYRQPLALFYSEDINDITGEAIGFNSDGDGFRVHRYEQAKATVYGFQTKISYELLRGLSATVVSDFVRAKNDDTKENIPQIPPFRFSVDLRYANPDYWYGASWNITAKQNDVAEDEEPTAGYGIVGLYAGVRILTGNYSNVISLKASNILDQKYKDHLSAIKDFTYMPGRNVTLSYKFIF
jgi:iron complex outermembrane receptor protein